MRRSILICLLSLTAAAQRRALSPEDLRLWRGDSDPRINSQGVSAVYTENWYGSAHYYSDIWLVDAKGKERRALSPGEWRDWSARWNPDGTEVAFLSDRSGKVQIYAMRMEPVGAATAVTRGDLTPLAFAWSPDGKWLAFTARVAADGARAAWAPASILPLVQAAGPGPVQVFLVAAGGGEAQRLTTSALDFSGEPAWMPDGRSLVCAAGGQIFSIRVADHAVRELTHNGMVNSEPVPAPDGSKIAWLAAEVKPQNYVVRHLWVMNAEGARDRMLGGALDRDVMHPQWSNDSRTVYFLADDQGSTHLYAGRNDGTARQATSRVERLSGFSLADNGRAVTVRSTGTEGGNVITFTTDVPGGVTTLSEPNGGLMADRHLAAVEEIHYESEGKSIQAWLVKPPQFDASKKYPLLLDVRDDPRAMYGVEFRLRQQILASAGYVVVCANPRGTPGYGEEFGHLLRTRSPGDDADDLLRGVEYVVKQGYVDEKRIGVVGGMTAAWLIGHTDRFSRAVLRRPLVDWAADLRRARAELGVWPWEDAELYTKRSPIFSMGSVKTPTLILAGEGDGQSEQLFYALQQRKVETVLVRSPDEVQELQAILGWMGR